MTKTYPTLAAALEEKGLTQEQAAAALQIRQGDMSLYVRRLSTPRLDVALRIHKKFGVALEGLIRVAA